VVHGQVQRLPPLLAHAPQHAAAVAHPGRGQGVALGGAAGEGGGVDEGRGGTAQHTGVSIQLLVVSLLHSL
jgi:hypothetical protein